MVSLDKVPTYTVRLKTSQVKSVSIIANVVQHRVAVVNDQNQEVAVFAWEGASYNLARVTGPLASLMIACGYDANWASTVRARHAGWEAEIHDLTLVKKD